MKTFVMGLLVAAVASALLSTSAHAGNPLDFSSYYGAILQSGSGTDLRSQSLNAVGLSWAVSMRGKKVGAGECTDLVKMHLVYSHAMPADFKDYRHYVWGALVTRGFRPGDVIQFEGCKFKWTKGNSWGETNRDHHTAIIVGGSGNGCFCSIRMLPFAGRSCWSRWTSVRRWREAIQSGDPLFANLS